MLNEESSLRFSIGKILTGTGSSDLTAKKVLSQVDSFILLMLFKVRGIAGVIVGVSRSNFEYIHQLYATINTNKIK